MPQKSSLTPLQRARICQRAVRAIALIYPVPSKCDQDGTACCNKGILFPVDIDNALSAGFLLLRLEEVVDPSDRDRAPLFAHEACDPFLGTDMDRALRDALLLRFPDTAVLKSWHSYRIRLASKLRAAVGPSGALLYTDAVIQAFLRWKTTSSLNVHARYDTATYAAVLQRVEHLDISSVQYADLPEMSERPRLDELEASAETDLPLALDEPGSAPLPASTRSRCPASANPSFSQQDASVSYSLVSSSTSASGRRQSAAGAERARVARPQPSIDLAASSPTAPGSLWTGSAGPRLRTTLEYDTDPTSGGGQARRAPSGRRSHIIIDDDQSSTASEEPLPAKSFHQPSTRRRPVLQHSYS